MGEQSMGENLAKTLGPYPDVKVQAARKVISQAAQERLSLKQFLLAMASSFVETR